MDQFAQGARALLARARARGPLARAVVAGVVLLAVGSLGVGVGWSLARRAPTTPRPGATVTRVAHATATVSRPTATATPVPSRFQAGLAYPRWGTSVYGPGDATYNAGIGSMRAQTGAGWVEIVVELYQDTNGSTTVHYGPATAPAGDIQAGIDAAHAAGLHVFVVPHLDVNSPAGQWSGTVWVDPSQAQAWFDSYYQALAPYLAAAQAARAEQFAIGTEMNGMEGESSALWTELIARAHAAFSGHLTYDINWDRMGAPRSWMRDPNLTYLGVSEYQSVANQPVALSEAKIEAFWRQQLLPQFDKFSAATGKPVILSEVGYHYTSDALWNPWRHTSSAPADPRLQADAYTAATRAVYGDPHVVGIYFWAWQNGPFATSAQAASALLALYPKPPMR